MVVSSPPRKRRKVSAPSRGIQLDFLAELFPPPDIPPAGYSETEKILYLLWDGIKRQRREQFLEANQSCAYYLTEEQYEILFKEILSRLTLADKTWILKTITDGTASIINFLFPCRHQLYNLCQGGDFFLFCYLTYFFLLWENS